MASSRGDLEEEEEHFRFINERAVDDISLEIFYKPHTITLLTVSVLGLLYLAFTRLMNRDAFLTRKRSPDENCVNSQSPAKKLKEAKHSKVTMEHNFKEK